MKTSDDFKLSTVLTCWSGGIAKLCAFAVIFFGSVLNAADDSYWTNQSASASIDSAAGLVYWADSGNGQIKYANLDGSGTEHVLYTDILTPPNSPVGLTIDPIGGFIYWTTFENNQIRQGHLDGSGFSNLYTDLGSPNSLAIDQPNGVLYWSNNIGSIMSCTINNCAATAAALYTGVNNRA